jgi:hypothetical protein
METLDELLLWLRDTTAEDGEWLGGGFTQAEVLLQWLPVRYGEAD